MNDRKPNQLADRPIFSFEEDIMWRDIPLVGFYIKDVAGRLIEPLISDPKQQLGSNSLAFAIHGAWGSGKTSLTRLIIELARNMLKDKGTTGLLLNTTYVASAAAATKRSARASLAQHLLTALAKDANPTGDANKEAVKLFAHYLGYMAEDDERLNDKVFIGQQLDQISLLLSQLTNFDSVIWGELTKGPAGEPIVLVVVIDDLDRCSSEFITEVLETINYWSSVDNLFFLVTIARDVLTEAIEKVYTEQRGLVSDPLVALEKYIQYSFEISPA